MMATVLRTVEETVGLIILLKVHKRIAFWCLSKFLNPIRKDNYKPIFGYQLWINALRTNCHQMEEESSLCISIRLCHHP